MTVKVTETYTRHQAVTPTFILQVARGVRLCETKLLRPASCDATALRRDQKRRRSITDGCVGLLATRVVLTEAELSLIGSSSLCNSNADDTSSRHCTYEIELLRLLGFGYSLT